MLLIPIQNYDHFLHRLKQIFADMDDAYHKTADQYGFLCAGCEDNCCLTRFYHHTLLELSCLFKGWQMLLPEKQREIQKKAESVCFQASELEKENKPIRLMCPLNENGMCLLYDYRPMICRLHGIAHELHRPDGQVVYGPGCDVFTKISESKGYIRFDRTPFYKRMAMLEKELREKSGITRKIKMTIAEMIVSEFLPQEKNQ